LRALQREASANQALLETFLQWLKKTSGIQEFQQPDARVISYAEPPLRASFPQKRLMVGLAFLASLGLAVALALVFEHLDRSFRSADQVEAQTLQRNLAVIPKVTGRLFRRGVPEDYVLHRPRSAFAEGLRTLHANLVLGDDDPPKILLFSSACPREGKTSLALSYARLLAGQGARVTLVDADLHHGRIARRLGIDERPGLADLLAVEASIDDVLERDPEARLAVIPHGGSRRTPQELLLGAQFGKLLQRLAIANDFVIIDSPPVLAVADAPLFARHADKTVYVVHWGATAGEEAITGLRRLQEAGADVAGVVLNAVDMRKYAEYAYGSPGTYRRAMERYYVG
jgi:capsular exopolysaccharide synthesis family protein